MTDERDTVRAVVDQAIEHPGRRYSFKTQGIQTTSLSRTYTEVARRFADIRLSDGYVEVRVLGGEEEETPPDIEYDWVVLPIVGWALEEIDKFMSGTSKGYDNVQAILEEVVYLAIGAERGNTNSPIFQREGDTEHGEILGRHRRGS
jgi:hypothetical protein